MDCGECGAELEEDAKFCSGCRARVAPAEEVPADEAAPVERAAPSGAPGPGMRIVGVLLALATIGLGVAKLMNRPTARIEVIDVPDLGGYSAPAAAGPAPEVLRQAPADRAPNESERVLAGTMVATVGVNAPRPASAGGTLVQLEGLQRGQVDALTRCMWLELYPNLRGFQHECGVVNGEPSVLDRTDVLTGRRTSLGVAFRWSFDAGRLSITYDEDMTVSGPDGPARFVRTVLALPQGSPPFDVQQSFPEHPQITALTHRFDVFPGAYLGDGAADAVPSFP